MGARGAKGDYGEWGEVRVLRRAPRPGAAHPSRGRPASISLIQRILFSYLIHQTRRPLSWLLASAGLLTSCYHAPQRQASAGAGSFSLARLVTFRVEEAGEPVELKETMGSGVR